MVVPFEEGSKIYLHIVDLSSIVFELDCNKS